MPQSRADGSKAWIDCLTSSPMSFDLRRRKVGTVVGGRVTRSRSLPEHAFAPLAPPWTLVGVLSARCFVPLQHVEHGRAAGRTRG